MSLRERILSDIEEAASVVSAGPAPGTPAAPRTPELEDRSLRQSQVHLLDQ